MKKLVHIISLCGLFLLWSCSNDDETLPPDMADVAIVVNGVAWAKYNVSAPGQFALSEASLGYYYQWNSSTGWKTGESLAGYPKDKENIITVWPHDYFVNADIKIWETKNNPCPEGWRIPTEAEYQSLIDNADSKKWVTTPPIGFLFTKDGKSVFFPASGFLCNLEGALYLMYKTGAYWSATRHSETNAYSLSFDDETYASSLKTDLCANGLPIRCVKNL